MVSFTSKDRAFYGPPSQTNSLLAAVRPCGGGEDIGAWELEEDKAKICPNLLLY
jgi:hypothetical protein